MRLYSFENECFSNLLQHQGTVTQLSLKVSGKAQGVLINDLLRSIRYPLLPILYWASHSNLQGQCSCLFYFLTWKGTHYFWCISIGLTACIGTVSVDFCLHMAEIKNEHNYTSVRCNSFFNEALECYISVHLFCWEVMWHYLSYEFSKLAIFLFLVYFNLFSLSCQNIMHPSCPLVYDVCICIITHHLPLSHSLKVILFTRTDHFSALWWKKLLEDAQKTNIKIRILSESSYIFHFIRACTKCVLTPSESMSSSNIQYITACHSRTLSQIYIEWLWFKNHIEKDWNIFVLKSLPLLIIQFGGIGENPRKKSIKVSFCSCTSHINPSAWSTACYKQTDFYLPPQPHLAGIYIPTD